MSTEQSNVVTVRAGSVAVEKSFEPDEFPVPAIAFVVRSESEAGGRVRVVDDLPEGVGPEDVGFHPDYGEEYWTVEEERIVFEREFDPEEEYTTVYGLRDDDLETVERFLEEPLVESETDADPDSDSDSDSNPGEEFDDVLGDDEQVVRDVLSGAVDTIPGLEDDDEIEPLDLETPAVPADAADANDENGEVGTEAGAGEEDASLDLGGSDGAADTEGAAAGASEFTAGDVLPDSAGAAGEAGGRDEDGEAGSAPGDDPDAVPADGSVAAALVEELRAGTVDESVERALRSELGADASDAGSDGDGDADGGSTDARIRHLQSEVADLRAYTDALESFLDENGDAHRLLADLRGEISDLSARIDGVGERVTAVDDRLDAVDERVAGLDDRLAAATDDVAAVDDRVDDFERTTDALDERGDDLAERIDDVDGRLADLRSEAAAAETLSSATDRIDDVDDRLEDLAEDVAGLDDLDDDLEDVAADVRERLDEIEADIVEIEAFRKRMANVFGGGSGGSEDGDDVGTDTDADES